MRLTVHLALSAVALFVCTAVFGGAMLARRSAVAAHGVVARREVIRHGCRCETVELTFADGTVARFANDDDLRRVREGDVLVKRRGQLGYSVNGAWHPWWGTLPFALMAALGSGGLVLLAVLAIMARRRSQQGKARLPRALCLR